MANEEWGGGRSGGGRAGMVEDVPGGIDGGSGFIGDGGTCCIGDGGTQV